MNNAVISIFMATALLLVSSNFIVENKKEVTIQTEELIIEDDKNVEENLVFEVRDITIENYTDNKYISCCYPRITSLKDDDFENQINKEIGLSVNEYISEIEYIIEIEYLENEAASTDKLYKYVATYDKYACDKYASLIINQTYETGGIRSNSWKDIYNIDLENEKIIYLSDLFEKNIDYEKAIIEEINKQASEKNINLMIGNGVTKLSAKQKFYIKDDSLVIYYDPSEIAPSNYGFLEFEMPFKLNSNGYFEI